MSIPTLAAIAAASYLLGSIPFGYILVRSCQGIDVRSIGSGNIGATNVARTGGKKLAILTLLLDALKGWLPVFVILHTGLVPAASAAELHTLASFSALMAVVGHMFPVWLRFKGGKGVATGLGVFLALAPWAILCCLALFLAVVAVTRYVSLGSILAAVLFPLAAWELERGLFPAPALAMCAAVALLVVVRHHQNIGRLLAGTEHRLGERKA
ncbi:MAG: glycerol-3-phosphate 1-O-acyltransferase PlsY [Acidobacteriota bacterium]|nr:glycerol-3-phosphate 1-O-acyltransferase PlsY [Acidobacteriota bacterium]